MKIMGILNITPDSFSDGGKFFNKDKAIEHAFKLIEYGADIIDIGGESTRPGAESVSVKEELSRVINVIAQVKNKYPDCMISIDTTKYEVALEAVNAGADIINDISGLQKTPELAAIAAEYNKKIVLMHMRGTPATMQNPENLIYNNLIEDIVNFLVSAASKAQKYGVKKDSIIIDPGIGFSKTTEQNIAIIKNIKRFTKLGYALLVGPSRKSFIGEILNEPQPHKRVWGTAGAVAWLALNNVNIIRVHDVLEMKQMLTVLEKIYGSYMSENR